MPHQPHKEPMIPVWWNRFRILGSIGLAATLVGTGLVIEEAERYDSPLSIVIGAALIVIGSSTVLFSASVWYQSRGESLLPERAVTPEKRS